MKHLFLSGRFMVTQQRARCCGVRFRSSSSAKPDIVEGEVLRLEHAFLQEDVNAYASIAGDPNPIHTSPAAASSAGFSACIVHGMLCASLFPALFASRLPGARIESKTLRFKDPAFVGDCLEAEAKVLNICSKDKSLRIEFNMECYKKLGRILVLEGKSRVIVPQL